MKIKHSILLVTALALTTFSFATPKPDCHKPKPPVVNPKLPVTPPITIQGGTTSTNTNTNSNTNTQSQAQSQSQSQSMNNSGNSSSSSSVKNSGNSSSTSSANNNGNGNGDGSNNTAIVTKESQIPVATAYAPTIIPTVPCFKGLSGGVQTMAAGVSFGGGKVDPNCAMIETAKAFLEGGARSAYCKVLIQNKYAKEAGVTLDDCMAVVTVEKAAVPTTAPKTAVAVGPAVAIVTPVPAEPTPAPVQPEPVAPEKHISE